MYSQELELFKEVPGYKSILKAVLKSQIQMLVSYIHVGKEVPGYKSILKAVLRSQIQMLVS